MALPCLQSLSVDVFLLFIQFLSTFTTSYVAVTKDTSVEQISPSRQYHSPISMSPEMQEPSSKAKAEHRLHSRAVDAENISSKRNA